MTGKPLIDKILMGINLLGLLSVLGVFIYTTKIHKKPLPDNSLEDQKLVDEASQASLVAPYKIDPFIINLKSTSSRMRYLNLELHLIAFQENDRTHFDTFKPMMRDLIFQVAGNMSPEELTTITGRMVLSQRLKDSLNQLFPKPLVKEVFFANFVVQ